MKRLIYIFAIFSGLCVLGTGCKESDNKDMSARELYGDVMELHDISMLKMDSIYIKVAELREVHQSLEQDTTSDHNLRKKEIMAAITQLKKADDAMMDWMKQIREPDAEDSTARAYLREQRLSIIAVDNQIDESIEHGNFVLNKVKMLGEDE